MPATSLCLGRQKTAPIYNTFIETYRMLRAAINTPIAHMVIPGVNFTKAVLQFAESVKADMILVDPVQQGRVSILPGQQLNDLIKGNSKLEVLSVQV